MLHRRGQGGPERTKALIIAPYRPDAQFEKIKFGWVRTAWHNGQGDQAQRKASYPRQDLARKADALRAVGSLALVAAPAALSALAL